MNLPSMLGPCWESAMKDARLRFLERDWLASGGPREAAAYCQSILRVGSLSDSEIALLEHLGEGALGLDPVTWLAGFAELGGQAAVRAAYALAREVAGSFASDLEALEVTEDWLRGQGSRADLLRSTSTQTPPDSWLGRSACEVVAATTAAVALRAYSDLHATLRMAEELRTLAQLILGRPATKWGLVAPFSAEMTPGRLVELVQRAMIPWALQRGEEGESLGH